MDSTNNVLGRVRHVLRHPHQLLGTKEENTKLKVIVPLLEWLGIDLFNDALFELDTDCGTVDLFIRHDGKPFAIVEMKWWGSRFDNRDRERFTDYRTRIVPRAPLAVLTSGNRWEFWLRDSGEEPTLLRLDPSLREADLEVLRTFLGADAARRCGAR